MRRRVLIPSVLSAFVVILAAGIGIARHIANQRRPPWERYTLPRMDFNAEPTRNIVTLINAAVQKASQGAVDRAFILDATPAPIKKFAPSDELGRRMDQMIADFRLDEQELVRKGAMGYETAPYTGSVGGGEPLCCFAEDLAMQTGLDLDIEPDALHLSRRPRSLECRAYRISSGLKNFMEQQRQANKLYADVQPIVSAFVTASGIRDWSIMIPDGPNGWKGESRFDKVFQHVPESDTVLAIATPEEHAEAERRLKASGCWADWK